MATLIGLKRGTTNITVSYTEGGTTKTGSKSNFVVEGLPSTPPTFNNTSVSAQLVPTSATNSPAVNCGAFTAATAGHSGSITYSIVSVKNSGGTTLSGWTMTTTTSRIIKVPASTAGGTYTAVVRATEGPTDTYAESYTDATITITVNKKSQTAPSITSSGAEYDPAGGSISGSASGGSAIGTKYFKSDANGGISYGSATTTAPSRSKTSVGTTTYIAYYSGNNYWSQSPDSAQGGLTITQRQVGITAPTKTDTTYNTVAQTIFTAGSCTAGGTVYYSTLDTNFVSTKWSTTIPYTSKTNAGTYTLYWYCYVADTSNNTDDTSDNNVINSKYSISATISKATPYAPILTSGYRATYNGSPVYATAKVSASCSNPSSIATPAGTIYYGEASGATTYSIPASTTAASLTSMSRTNVGTTSIWTFFAPTDSANYNNSANASTVAKVSKKASNTVTYAVQSSSVWCGTDASARSTTNAAKTVTVATSSATATAGSITYAVSVKNASNVSVSGWSVSSDGKTVTTSAATAAGVYTVSVTATASATTNYSSGTKTVSSTVTVSAVSLSSVALTLSVSSVAYNGTTGVSSLIATYNNSASKNITSSIGISTNSNPKIVSDDTTIATIS